MGNLRMLMIIKSYIMTIASLLFVLTLISNNVSAQEVGTDNEIIEQTNDDIAAGEKEISDHVIQKRLQNIYKNINHDNQNPVFFGGCRIGHCCFITY